MPEPASVVTIRFAHVDAAGIVFYPRYFEMLIRAFEQVATLRGQFQLETEFMRPNKLGDQMTLSAESTDNGFLMSGSQADQTHFQVSLCNFDKITLPAPGRTAFASPPFTVHAIECGPDRHWHLPRYFEAINRAVEQWFADMQWPFSHLHSSRREGVPTVRLETQCLRLPLEGDVLHFQLVPVKVSRRSIQFESALMHGRECLIRSRQILVYVEHFQDGIRSRELPEPLRKALKN